MIVVLDEIDAADTMLCSAATMGIQHGCLHISAVDVLLIVDVQHGFHAAQARCIDPSLALEIDPTCSFDQTYVNPVWPVYLDHAK